MVKKLAPVQFDFASWWRETLQKGEISSGVEKAFLKIKEHYEYVAEWVYEDALEHGLDAAEAEAEYGLSLHTALVKYKDLHWLRNTFESFDFLNLSFEIASSVYPNDEWVPLENGELAVVTNRDRTIVFDLKYFDVLSASASLHLVEDPELVVTRKVREEVNKFYEARHQQQLMIIEKMQKDLESHSKEAQILPLKRD